MKIKQVREELLEFDNGFTITSDFEPECGEYNYADFTALNDTVAMDVDFDENIKFELSGDSGFRFGSNEKGWYYVPCYSDQGGCYSTQVDILFNGKKVLDVKDAEMVISDREIGR